MNARLIGWIFVLTAFATLSLSLSANPEPAGQDNNRAPDVPERKSITLQANKITVSKALAEFTKQTGIRVEDARGVPDGAIHLDWKQIPFWQALDALAAASKSRVNIYPTSGRIVLDKRSADYQLPPICYDGRFRQCVKKVMTSRDLEISDKKDTAARRTSASKSLGIRNCCRFIWRRGRTRYGWLQYAARQARQLARPLSHAGQPHRDADQVRLQGYSAAVR